VTDHDDLVFNEVFSPTCWCLRRTSSVTSTNGWRVAGGSLGDERNMLWLSYADRFQDLIDDWRPHTIVEKDQFATRVMDNYALRGLGSTALARAARGDEAVAAPSVLKLLGAETVQAATERA
jgi:hypothetical protein